MLARQIAIGFGLTILFPLLIYYGVSTFSHPPKSEDFYTIAPLGTNASSEERAAWQDKRKQEMAQYKEASRIFSLRLLSVSAPLGYLAIIFGALGRPSGLRTGLIFGGIFAVINGYWSHWTYVEDWLRFGSLLVAMAVLMLVAYWQVPGSRKTTVSG